MRSPQWPGAIRRPGRTAHHDRPAACFGEPERYPRSDVSFQRGGAAPDLPPLPQDIYGVLHGRMVAAIEAVARQKNISMLPVEANPLANQTLAFSHFHGLCGKLYCGDELTLEFLECAIDGALDHVAASRAVLSAAAAYGLRRSDLDQQLLWLWVDEIVGRLRCRTPPGSFYRWTDDPTYAGHAVLAGLGIPAIGATWGVS